MMNVYSCGCTARNVPILTRCSEHNGHVVVLSNSDVAKDRRASSLSQDRKFALLYDSLLGGMSRVKTDSVGLVFTYPDHFPFVAREAVVTSAFLDFPDMFFPECNRVLRKDGHIVLIVEYNILSSVIYCAVYNNFKVNSVSTVKMEIMDDPIGHDFLNKYQVYKAAVVLSPKNSKSNLRLGNMRLNNAGRIAERFHDRGTILDTSCIHYPFVLASHKKAPTIGIVSDKKRYDSLRQKVKEIPAA